MAKYNDYISDIGWFTKPQEFAPPFPPSHVVPPAWDIRHLWKALFKGTNLFIERWTRCPNKRKRRDLALESI